jgi:uncharacterized membrane protein
MKQTMVYQTGYNKIPGSRFRGLFSDKMIHLVFKKIFMAAFVVCLLTMGQACKSSKKAKAAQAQAEEARLAKEKEERLRREDEERRKKEEEERAKNEPTRKVESYFQSIASAGSIESANAKIDEALGLFSSPDAPVLIIIKRTGDIIDYDKPTTIKGYLNYLKDQKKTFNKVDKIEYDANGKIKELILITK